MLYEKANQIVDIVLKDLRLRKGIGDELDMIDEDIQQEIQETLTNKVRIFLAREEELRGY